MLTVSGNDECYEKYGKQLYSDYERAILDEWSGKASQRM